MNAETEAYVNHETIALLLPWYANNSLTPDEKATLERHLPICQSCSHELLLLQKVALSITSTGATFNGKGQPSFTRLKQRLHAENTPPPVEAKVIPLNSWAPRLKAGITRPGLALAASVLIAIFAFARISLLPGNYHTVADKAAIPSLQADETPSQALRIIFKANTPQQTIDKAVASVNAHIVSGPDTKSVYTLGFAPTIDTGHLSDSLAKLRRNTAVIFAEPDYAILSKPAAKGEKS